MTEKQLRAHVNKHTEEDGPSDGRMETREDTVFVNAAASNPKETSSTEGRDEENNDEGEKSMLTRRAIKEKESGSGRKLRKIKTKTGKRPSDGVELCKFRAIQERSSQSETEGEWYWESDDGWTDPGRQNDGQRKKWTKHTTTDRMTEEYWGDHESIASMQQQDRGRMSSRETNGSDDRDPEDTTYQPETQTSAEDGGDNIGGDYIL